MGFYAIAFAVDVLISTVCVWLASRLAFLKINMTALAFIVGAVSIVSLIPWIGWVAGLVLFVFLLMQLAEVELGDAIWVVFFTKLVSFGAILFFVPMLV